MNEDWKSKISHISQIGGIETSILDNGMGRSNRIAWVNTGSGMRYKIIIDRAMDIAEAFMNDKGLAWISHFGTTSPDYSANEGLGWLRTFSGGLLSTCGLSNIGGPETDEYGSRGLHGRIGNLPAELIAVHQPSANSESQEMSISGIMRESSVFGPALELKRTISSSLFESKIKIRDEVLNKGNTPSPLMVLYHCNFGYPLVDEGSEILWEGTWKSRGNVGDHEIFNDTNNFKTCPRPLKEHNGSGEAVAFIQPKGSAKDQCCCGIYNRKKNLAIFIRYNRKQLPWLTNWQHWGEREYVTGLEPGTNPPIGQKLARETNTLKFIKPNETIIFEIEIEILTDPDKIHTIIEKEIHFR